MLITNDKLITIINFMDDQNAKVTNLVLNNDSSVLVFYDKMNIAKTKMQSRSCVITSEGDVLDDKEL